MSFDEMLGAIRSAEAGDGEPDLVDATRLRVMRSLEARARGRHRLVGLATMVGVLLVGTVSWALATGQVIALWRPAAEPQLAPAPPPAAPPTPPPSRPRPRRHADHAPPAQPSPAEPSEIASPEPELVPPTPDVIPTAPEFVPPSLPSLAQPPAVAPSTPEAVAPPHPVVPPQPVVPPHRAAAAPPRASTVEPVEVLYRKAHELHFHGGDPAAALAAWDAYLAAEPDGRFSIEARYNRALVLVRLGRYAEARDALAPFARGETASPGYRRAEAEQLVERLARLP
jgi:hypothetical protein